MFCTIRPPAGFFSNAMPWSKLPRTSWERSPAARPSCIANDVLPTKRISCAGSFMLSGIGICTGPAKMPDTSGWMPSSSPKRDDRIEASASFIDCATGEANCAQESSVPFTQSVRVSTFVSPSAGLNSQAVSSHRFASLIARRAISPYSALTLLSEPLPLACCNASDFASLTLMGPSCAMRSISPMVFRPPAVNACIMDCTSDGLGSSLGSRLINCSRSSSGRLDS